MELNKFYSDKFRMSYNPEKHILKNKFHHKLIAFDDRFINVTDRLIKYIKLSGKDKLNFLDVGIGDGVYEKMLGKYLNRLQVYGLDISQKQLDRAKNYVNSAKVLNVDSGKMPYKNDFFDIILISELLEHVFYPEKVLKEVSRILKPGGILVITYPNSGSLQLRISLMIFGSSPLLNYSQNKEHIRFFNKVDILNLLGQDMKILEFCGLGSLLFTKWNFKFKIYVPRALQILFNKKLPGLALGNLLILQK